MFEIKLKSVLETQGVPKFVFTKLRTTYLLLTLTICSCILGASLVQYSSIPSFVIRLSLFALTFATVIPTISLPIRFISLLSVGFLSGLQLKPLLQFIDFDEQTILISSIATALVFMSFTLSALFAERRSTLYLGGILSSSLTLLVFLGFINYFLVSNFIFSLQLYGGLLLFVGFICFDTQLMIERFSNGSNDVIYHALNLFLDVLNVFIRILLIINKLKKQSSKSSNKRR